MIGDVGPVFDEDLAVRSGDRQRPICAEIEGPADFVDDVMMPSAERYQVVEIGDPAVFPREDVVDVATVEGNVAAPESCADRRAGTGQPNKPSTRVMSRVSGWTVAWTEPAVP